MNFARNEVDGIGTVETITTPATIYYVNVGHYLSSNDHPGGNFTIEITKEVSLA